jgi:sugar (pentulose or hexulose) kinase
MVASVHSGHYGSLSDAANNMVKMAAVVEPDEKSKSTYDYYYAKYKATYPALRDLMHDLTASAPAF